ncbi:MAG: serine/threonine-protein kinase [Planctomycetota bacterium]
MNLPDSTLYASATASGLVDAQQMDYALRVCRHRLNQQGNPSDASIPDSLLSEVLIEQEVLTQYQADQLLSGRTKFLLGPYLITDWIGQGGMGQVFKGVHQIMGREVAVKVLPRSRATQEAQASFAREIQMQAGLDCPYLVRAFDAGQDGNVHFLVTEYVPGMDLRRLVKSQGALPIQQAAKIIFQAALGLEYAHTQGLVHRDVKPGNILVTPEGDAKVSDVGLAGFAKDLINDPRAGKIVGTTDYLSPEQIRTPLDINPASDIYSLGCTLYYAVCGKVPFPGGNTESKLRRHLEEFPLHPRNFAPEITEDFVDIIVDMMEKDPKKRIANATEVASRLEPWAVDSMMAPVVSMTKSPWLAPPPPSHRDERQLLDEEGGSKSSSMGLPSEGRALPQRYESNETYSETQTDEASNTRPDDDWNSQAAPTEAPPIDSPLPQRTDQESALASDLPSGARDGNKWGIVGITIAIVVPPAILVGAIIGFLVAQNQ